MPTERILVIKLGALGDIIMALGPMSAIRRHHPHAEVSVLTRPAFASLLQASGLADRVLSDPAPRLSQPRQLVTLGKILRAGRFDLVYDLQGNDRTRLYRALLWSGRRPHWSRLAKPSGDRRHASHRLADQLQRAGIEKIPPPDLSWLDADLTQLDLPEKILLLVPGSAPQRPEKRWPAGAYGELAGQVARCGSTPVIIGTAAEAAAARVIGDLCPRALDLTGKTSIAQVAALGRRAVGAIGNDTGPMHVLCATGCPGLVLFSAASNPEANLPLGPSVGFLRAERLDDLPVQSVLEGARSLGFLPHETGSA